MSRVLVGSHIGWCRHCERKVTAVIPEGTKSSDHDLHVRCSECEAIVLCDRGGSRVPHEVIA